MGLGSCFSGTLPVGTLDNEVASVGESRDELRERLKLINERQILLLEITQRIAAGGSLGAMLPDILKTTLRASHADGIRVIVESPDNTLTYASGTSAGKMVKFDMPVAQLVAERGQVAVPDLAKTRNINGLE